MYKKFEIKLIAVSVFVILISGCASTGVVQMEKGVYYISEQDATLTSNVTASTIKKVYNEANQFCARQGKVVKTINKTFTTMAYARYPSLSLEFRCVNK